VCLPRWRQPGDRLAIAPPDLCHGLEARPVLQAMLGQKTNWARNLRADGHAVLRRGRPEDVSLVEDLSDNRAAILRRYLEVAAGARPFFPVDRHAPLTEFERIVDLYPVFRVA